jgi:hypothetical protein
VAATSRWHGREIRLVTALAEGADRMAAEVALETVGVGQFEALLPMPVEEYRRDFDQNSIVEFHRLLARARREEAVPAPAGANLRRPQDRLEAYVRGGLEMLARSEAIVAVGDCEVARERSVTAEIVSVARSKGLPLAWVGFEPDDEVRYERWPE